MIERRTSLILADAPLRNEGFAFLIPTPWDARQRRTNVVGRSIEATLDGNAGAHTTTLPEPPAPHPQAASFGGLVVVPGE